jgi:hypothetical protein
MIAKNCSGGTVGIGATSYSRMIIPSMTANA